MTEVATDLVKDGIKAAVGMLIADYRLNWIYASSGIPEATGPEVVEAAPEHYGAIAESLTPKVKGSLSYARQGLPGMVLLENGRPASVAHFARPEQYSRHATWPLRTNEVALVDIATEQSERGRGLAVSLIRGATRRYLEAGADRVLAFIWWTNTPSVRAFRKAGWRRIGFSAEWQWRGRWYALRIPLG